MLRQNNKNLFPLTNSPFLLLAIACMYACGGAGKSSTNASLPDNTKAVALNLPDSGVGKIVFLTLQMTLLDSASEKYDFQLTQRQFVEGQLKAKSLLSGNAIEPHYLYCTVSTKSGEAKPVIPVPNPLYQVYEYPGEDAKTVAKAVFKKRTGELFLRFQWHPEDAWLTISLPNPDLKTYKTIYHAKL